MERAVNKSTSKHVKPLKAKHIQVLTTVTWTREISIADLFYLIEKRMKDNSWVVMLKCLILIHILMREGYTERVTGFIAGNPTILDVSWFRDKTMSPTAIQQTENIRNYATYLQDKVFVFREIKDDFVKSKNDIVIKLRSMTAETGLLVQVSLLQRQVSALLGCSFYAEEIDNVVTLQAFRMLVGDMMALFHLLNEGVIRILGIFFEMERDDAQKAMDIYKKFAGQAQRIIDFFDIARRLRSDLGIDIPHFKHVCFRSTRAYDLRYAMHSRRIY
ncbi:uncharacterized protein BJ171DRAFT_17831 [Polychytrium aggregatum]|uniref:uncharacterized protein n=1 Tax=Polychytrium aggregatum TaxID=110093 RepID=UPI0022FDC549|nr:uncharacterized protein BJ171DRAFT_17831 [Polychytrium aggregatum]KAI9206714.1 AP180 N-terminal homology domain-containing protein [Polychytrium aggregatum]